jgi:hypothetical protein
MRLNLDAVSQKRRARRRRVILSLDFDETQPAAADRGKARIVAQRGDVDS